MPVLNDSSGLTQPTIYRLGPRIGLFQTGYLTIAGYNKERMEYTLAYPNFEVKNSMTECLTEAYSFVEREMVNGYAWKLIDALRGHDFNGFFDTLSVFFADIPYDLHTCLRAGTHRQIKKEKYYQTVFYLIFSLMGEWVVEKI